jgi:hypothetical protein
MSRHARFEDELDFAINEDLSSFNPVSIPYTKPARGGSAPPVVSIEVGRASTPFSRHVRQPPRYLRRPTTFSNRRGTYSPCTMASNLSFRKATLRTDGGRFLREHYRGQRREREWGDAKDSTKTTYKACKRTVQQGVR